MLALSSCAVLSFSAHPPRLIPAAAGRQAVAQGPSISGLQQQQLGEPTQHPALRCTSRVFQAIQMQATDFYDEYMQTDPETGESTPISLGEKEKLYLECLDAYYNEGGKQLLNDDDYERLKLDLDFEGSLVATYTADEIKFVIANKRYKMGKPILDDSQYDALRSRLKAAGSEVVLHEAPSCDLDSGICKLDLRVDKAKQRLLYIPGTTGILLLLCEVEFWTLGLDPFFSIILAAIPAYFGGKYFTENIFAQKPLVTTAPCPSCSTLNNVYFGDLFNVQSDGIIGPSLPPSDEIEFNCVNCKSKLTANRKTMVVSYKNEDLVKL